MNDRRDWFSISDLALPDGRWPLSEAKIRELIRAGQIQAHKFGERGTFVHRSAVVAFEQQARVMGTQG